MGRIKHIVWNDRDTIRDPIPYHAHSLHLDTHKRTVDIFVNVAYLGYAQMGSNRLKTTYSLDFRPFQRDHDHLQTPGSCSNRHIALRNDITSNHHRHLLHVPYPHPVGFPRPSSYWTLSSSKQCGPVTYHGHFTWNDLLHCTDPDGTVCSGITTKITQKWLNLTATLYVDIISSPLSQTADPIHFVHPLMSIPITIPLLKSNEKSSFKPNLDLFTMSVVAIYPSISGLMNGYKMVIYTESADWIVLSDPLLLSNPLRNGQKNPNIKLSAVPLLNQQHCINGGAFLCGQFWEISMDDIQCPAVSHSDLSGIWGFQFTASCNPSVLKQSSQIMQREYCTEYADLERQTTLSVPLSWSDTICDSSLWTVPLQSTLRFYREITFHDAVQEVHSPQPIDIEEEKDEDSTNSIPSLSSIPSFSWSGKSENAVFQAGEDTIFVALEVDVPFEGYTISEVRLSNVWVCTVDEEQYGGLSISDGADYESNGDSSGLIGGCLSPHIDGDGPLHLLRASAQSNEYFNAKHIVLDEDLEYGHSVRFSFVAPKGLLREKLFVHCQVTLTLQSHGDPFGEIDGIQTQIRHFGTNIVVKSRWDRIVNNLTMFGGVAMDKMVLAVILSIVLIVVYNLYVLRTKNRIEMVNYSNSEYDTESTANTASSSRSHKKLYHMIHGLYTSQDENHQNEAQTENGGKAKGKRRGKISRKQRADRRVQEQNGMDHHQDEVQSRSHKKSAAKLSDEVVVQKVENREDVVADSVHGDDEIHELETAKSITAETVLTVETAEVDSSIGMETDAVVLSMHSPFRPFRKVDVSDFTTDIQTLDELTTSCTDFSDVELKKSKSEEHGLEKEIEIRGTSQGRGVTTDTMHTNHVDGSLESVDGCTQTEERGRNLIIDKFEEMEQEIVERQYTYTSETEKEKRERVQLIRQLIEETQTEDTEYTETMTECTEYTLYSDEYAVGDHMSP